MSISVRTYRKLATKRHKYGAKGGYYCLDCFASHAKNWTGKSKRLCTCRGHIAYFGSKLEQRYWVKLKLLEKGGAITHLKHQVRYPIVISAKDNHNHDKIVGHYVADFTFYDKHEKRIRVLDAKGQEVPLTAFRRKCAEASNDIVVEIVR